jgi:glucose/arabinose dehydrogenase
MNNRRIVALPDRDKNGVADELVVVATGFKRAHSLAFLGNFMYVADRDRIFRYEDVEGDGSYQDRVIFADDIPSTGSHSTRTIVIDKFNDKIYLSVGWPCDMCRNDEPERGVILEFNTDGSGRRIFASGVRNVVGMDLHPETNQLWGTNNGHDKEGNQIPPEWVDVIREYGFYGVPLAYGYQNFIDFSIPDYEKNLPLTKTDSLLVSSMKPPIALLPAHTAPMGIHFYEGNLFPKRYKNAAFIALHAGHAKLAPSPGYKVIALFGEPDKSFVYREDFLTGFQTGTDIEDVWGYPVGITTDREGRLYLSSDKNVQAIFMVEHSPIIAKANYTMPDSVLAGSAVNVEAEVVIERSLRNNLSSTVEADLSTLGGSKSVLLTEVSTDHFKLSESIKTSALGGPKTIAIRVSQRSKETKATVRLPKNIFLLPVKKRPDYWIFNDGLSETWTVQNKTWIEKLPKDLNESKVVFSGQRAASFRGVDGDWDWNVRFRPSEPFDLVGYDWLSFAINLDGVTSPRQKSSYFSIYMGEKLVELFKEGHVDTSVGGWQLVKIKLNQFNLNSSLNQINFSGNFRGKFYLDAISFRSEEVDTSIKKDSYPFTQSFEFSDNYPNPFNSETKIRYAVPFDSHVSVTVFNATGQRVASLVKAMRPAGKYIATWDGRDEKGNDLATGLYLCQMRVSSLDLSPQEIGYSKTRKLMLIR